jgi:hypothetical protein
MTTQSRVQSLALGSEFRELQKKKMFAEADPTQDPRRWARKPTGLISF